MTDTVLFILEIVGTAVFAASGALAGLQRQLDAFGVVILGVCTACGGGVIRDLTLGITPPVMFCQPVYALVAMALFLSYRILDIADLTVDGSLTTGGAVCAVCITLGWNPWVALVVAILAGMLAGLVTGLLHTLCGIPAILAGILTQLGLYSVNMAIMSMKATVAINVTTNEMLGYVRDAAALVVEEPGLNSHAAIVGNSLLKPTIVGAAGACSHIRDGLDIAVDCAHGSVQRLQA